MKLKFYLASFIVCFSVMQAFAQKKQNVYFFKNDGRRVNVRDSSDYTRIVQEPDSGSVLFNVLEYYPNNNIKFIGKSHDISPLQLEGMAINYYPNKNRKTTANYENGRILGASYDYYPNEKLYRFIEYSLKDKMPSAKTISFIHNVFDSTGIEIVKEGNGHYQIFDNDYKTVLEEGDVKNGTKQGLWKGTVNNGKIKFTEEYLDGNFLNGNSTDDSNKTVSYTVRETSPTYKNGISAFLSYFYKNLKYADKNNNTITQKLLVVEFKVEVDGSVTHANVLKSFDPNINSKAIQVIEHSPKWIPAVQHGIPTSAYYSIGLLF